jgi:hypothetical protein
MVIATCFEFRSKFAQHLLENKHEIGPMESIMHIIHIINKGKMMDTLEKFDIYRETVAKNQINDKLTVQKNAISKTIAYEDPAWGPSQTVNWNKNSVVGSCSPPLDVKAAPRQKAIHYLHMGQQPSKLEEL